MQATGSTRFSSSSTPTSGIGEKYEYNGRTYRYVLNGASALVAGNCIQTRVEESTHDALVVVTGAAGSRDLTITTEASTGALEVNEYAGGLAVVDTTPGEGYSYTIDSHPVIAASSNGTLRLKEPIEVAMSTATRITLIYNPYSKVIQFPATTATGVPVGVAIYPIAANEYGWIQTRGACGVLILGTPAVGAQVTAVGATAGGASIMSGTLPLIGHMMETGRNTIICPVFLRLE